MIYIGTYYVRPETKRTASAPALKVSRDGRRPHDDSLLQALIPSKY